ncbi:phage holin family protein [Phytopseudomonas dryadis]|uniref:Phage holin family protein n=1 Tax=Phytopseudomonas dryadis TaxID=2487520 RepID=A0A4V2KCG3_9GAMM|nr:MULTISPECIES: phage holin family protein [Pseudomonas]TBU93977.1 phage holin family protein [Pseudomonas dryadis]TBV07861.1 phage holin family protein [Pseudomonas dryadis]TBV19256.1 phage holin family protein [Pseudomonas sp. FRB 230]
MSEEPGAPLPEPSILGLLRQLTREIQVLFTKELALAKVELNQSLQATKAGIAAIAGGAIVLLSGFLMLLLSAVYGLSTIVAPWLAALIVGVVVILIGLAMLKIGQKQFAPSQLTPERTLDALQKDKEAVQRQMS